MIAAALQLAGLYLLAAAMPPHRAALLPGKLSITRPRQASIAGWVALAASFVLAITVDGAIGLTTWLGLIALTGGTVMLGIAYAPRLLGAAVAVALGAGVVQLAG